MRQQKTTPVKLRLFIVDDIQFAFEALSSKGVIFESKPHFIAKMPDHDLWMAFFRDPDGNLLALMCEVRQTSKQ